LPVARGGISVLIEFAAEQITVEAVPGSSRGGFFISDGHWSRRPRRRAVSLLPNPKGRNFQKTAYPDTGDLTSFHGLSNRLLIKTQNFCSFWNTPEHLLSYRFHAVCLH
jgi:hypothetical protein